MPCVKLHFAELTPHDRVGTFTSNGRPVSGIFASISEFERELIRDRVRSGLAAVKLPGQTSVALLK
jgi:DNA invertase Pin-like site-specific DNA recombinase